MNDIAPAGRVYRPPVYAALAVVAVFVLAVGAVLQHVHAVVTVPENVDTVM